MRSLAAARSQRVVIPLDQEAAVAKHTIGDGRWGLVQEKTVDRVAGAPALSVAASASASCYPYYQAYPEEIEERLERESYWSDGPRLALEPLSPRPISRQGGGLLEPWGVIS